MTEAGPAGTTTGAYAYDEAGRRTTTRPAGAASQTMNWDAEGRPAKVTEPVTGGTAKATDHLYDSEGERLIERSGDETTLYPAASSRRPPGAHGPPLGAYASGRRPGPGGSGPRPRRPALHGSGPRPHRPLPAAPHRPLPADRSRPHPADRPCTVPARAPPDMAKKRR